MDLNLESVQAFTQQGIAWLIDIVPTFVLAMVTLVAGLWIIRRVMKSFRKLMETKHVEPTLANFGANLVGISLRLVLGITVISMLGVATTSFIAILGAAGLAIGLALQGNLANFAGGALILLFKPFKIGDYIIAQGVEGTVVDINVFCTALDTLDNQRVFVPNGPLSSNVLKNLSSNETRRVDVNVVLGGDVEVSKAKEMFTDVMTKEPMTLSVPAPFVSIEKFSDLGVHYTLRSWVDGNDYWDAYFKLHEATKQILEKNQMTAATPTRLIKHLDTISLGANNNQNSTQTGAPLN